MSEIKPGLYKCFELGRMATFGYALWHLGCVFSFCMLIVLIFKHTPKIDEWLWFLGFLSCAITGLTIVYVKSKK
jgi:hypothetical protein